MNRIPENIIFMLSSVGGWIGTISACYFCNHKTSKESFKNKLIITILFNLFFLK